MPQPLRNISLYSGFLAPPNQSYPLALDTLLRWIPFSVSHLDLLLCAATTSAPAYPELAQLKDQDQAWNIQPVFQNLWLKYKAIVVISQGQSVFLARHRNNKVALVNIHLLKQQFSSVKPLLETRSQFSYPSFLGLLGCYCWEDQVFLVWESVELLVSQILASRCTITEGEVAAIVRPVLEGIQYLRGRGRALAALSADTILLTESGGVRIAEIDAVTLKLFALAESAEAKGLPKELKSCCSPEELLRSKFFEQLGDEGELKMLVNAANKTAYHNLESFKRI
ncbi:hypothetical protein N7517_008097 [Penicillium concentricum]|uniref:Uncharacterized protein n=1 Tax=Penicillium concentricum TaxID=293559 RepID=A0A9W9RS43_9EURO|nr:uncharacterized protein N7517_008097 [Penicillium concentricum]KAJ5365211.1 hypothetical protein N7517_008097 [Penicillium concentricum]